MVQKKIRKLQKGQRMALKDATARSSPSSSGILGADELWEGAAPLSWVSPGRPPVLGPHLLPGSPSA